MIGMLKEGMESECEFLARSQEKRENSRGTKNHQRYRHLCAWKNAITEVNHTKRHRDSKAAVFSVGTSHWANESSSER